ncbi:MAG: hypothetical protein ACT4RN_04130 [Pseudonocardia sp.]
MSTTIRRALLTLLIGSALGTLLLAGCGTEPAAPAPAQVTAPTLPWPVGDPAGVELLQKRVDGGAQPWLLEPAEVATSFGTAAYGWQDAHAVLPGGTDTDTTGTDTGDPDTTGVDAASTGTAVELHGPDGKIARLVLAQPGRTGTGGIWVVTRAQAP